MSGLLRIVIYVFVAALFVAAAVLLITGMSRGVGIFLVLLGAVVARILIFNPDLASSSRQQSRDDS